jgi:hypothetical protein
MEETQVQYQSEFLPSITILVIFKEDEKYPLIKKFFREYGFGFLVPEKNLVIIDGENFLEDLDIDVLKFIEAHEISHVLLKHSGPRDDKEELEADLGAYLLLKDKGHGESLKYLLNHFKERHGIRFDESLLFDIRKKMGMV